MRTIVDTPCGHVNKYLVILPWSMNNIQHQGVFFFFDIAKQTLMIHHHKRTTRRHTMIQYLRIKSKESQVLVIYRWCGWKKQAILFIDIRHTYTWKKRSICWNCFIVNHRFQRDSMPQIHIENSSGSEKIDVIWIYRTDINTCGQWMI